MIRGARLVPYLVLALLVSPFVIFRKQAGRLWARLGIFGQGLYNADSLAKFIRQNDVETVKLYFKSGMSPNEEWLGSPVFFCAIYDLYLPVFDAVAEAGANFNLKDRDGNTVWRWTLGKSWKSRYCVEQILKHGGDVNLPDNKGNTALLLAVQSGLNIEPLLKAGANVNVKNKEGQTALSLALAQGDLRAARQLLKAGADLDSEGLRHHPAMGLISQLDDLEKMDPLSQTTFALSVVDRTFKSAPSSSSSDLQLVVAMGSIAVPVLIQGLRQAGASEQGFYISLLRAIGPEAAEAGPLIVQALQDKKIYSFDLPQTLPDIAANDIPTIDALIKVLQTEKDQETLGAVIYTLNAMGPQAARALPVLEQLKSAPNFSDNFRRSISQSIEQIRSLDFIKSIS